MGPHDPQHGFLHFQRIYRDIPLFEKLRLFVFRDRMPDHWYSFHLPSDLSVIIQPNNPKIADKFL